MNDIQVPLIFTDAAAKKVKSLIEGEDNPNLRLRVYITGGGCSGFQYGFTFDDQINDGDLTIENQNVGLVVDPMNSRLYRRIRWITFCGAKSKCEFNLRLRFFFQHLNWDKQIARLCLQAGYFYRFLQRPNYTLKRKCITSPSCTI